MMRIVPADLDHPDVAALVAYHGQEAHRNSPVAGIYALDLAGLRHPAMTVFAAWNGETLLGIGALRALASDHGEIKSMRTAPDHVCKGVGRAMLTHLLADARARGYTRVSLETGANEAFAPARALYESAGFVPSEPFGDYVLTNFNRCYTLLL